MCIPREVFLFVLQPFSSKSQKWMKILFVVGSRIIFEEQAFDPYTASPIASKAEEAA